MTTPIPWSIKVTDSIADNRLETIGSSLQMDWQLGENNYLVTGYEFSREELKASTTASTDVTVFRGSHQLTHQNIVTYRRNEGEQTTHAFFASMETQLPADFVLNYGARYTYVDTEQSKATASRFINSVRRGDDGSAGKTGSSDHSRVVFNAGVTWLGVKDLALRATWAQGFRSPLLQEMYLQNNMGGGTVIGNPDLKPETSNNFELGARFNRGALSLDATAFYSMADDYITQEKVANSTQKYINADKAKTHGIELATSYRFGAFTPYANVTWMRRKLESNDYSTWDSGTLNTDTYARSQVKTKSYSNSTKDTTEIAGFTIVFSLSE